MMTSSTQYRVGALLSYLTTLVSLLLGLLYTPWMIAVIGREDYGLYTLAISLISIFMMDFGIGVAVSRYLSVYYAKGEYDGANTFLGLVYRLYLILAGIIAVVLIAIYFFMGEIYVALDQSQLEIFKSLYVIVAFYSVVSVPFLAQNNVLIANERFIELRICTLVQKLFIVVLTIIALALGAGVLSLVVVNAMGNLLFILIKIVIIRRFTPARARFGKFDLGLMKEFTGFTGWVTVSQVCQRCNYNLMPSIMAVVSNASAIAAFGLASQLESYVYTVGDALGGLFMPKVARILQKDDFEEELLALMTKVGRLQVYIVGLIFIGFVAYGIPFVELWLGDGFDDVFYGTILLIAPSMISLPQTIGTVALTTSNKVKYQAYANILMAAACVMLGFPLSSAFGAIGACGAISAGLMLNRILNNYYYKKHLGIRLAVFFKESYLRWMISSTVLTIAAIAIQEWLRCDGWALFFLCVSVFSIVYFVVCWLFCYNEYEKELLVGLFRKVVPFWR